MLSEPCGSEGGDMMTPPQRAPMDQTDGEPSEAEMSFRDLVDDSDDEEQEGRLTVKSMGSGQVLVDPEDLQVRPLPHVCVCALHSYFGCSISQCCGCATTIQLRRNCYDGYGCCHPGFERL